MNRIFILNFILFVSTTIFSFAATDTEYTPIINDDIVILVPTIEPLITKIIGNSSLCLIGSKFFRANVTGSVNLVRSNITHIWEVTTKPSGSNMLGKQGRFFHAKPDVLGEYTLSLTSTYRTHMWGVPFGPIFISTDIKKFTLNDCSGQPITMTVSILDYYPGLVWEGDHILFAAIPTVRNIEEPNISYMWSVISKPPGSTSTFGSAKRLKYPDLYVDLLGTYTIKVVATLAGISSSDTFTFTADQTY